MINKFKPNNAAKTILREYVYGIISLNDAYKGISSICDDYNMPDCIKEIEFDLDVAVGLKEDCSNEFMDKIEDKIKIKILKLI